MSTIEYNKNNATLRLGLVNEGDTEDTCKMTALKWKMYRGAPRMPADTEATRSLFSTSDQNDQQWTVNQKIVECNMVAVRDINSCTNSRFLGIPATDKGQVFMSTFIFPNIWWNGGGNVA